MDVFDVHRKLIEDYKEFTTAFVDIHDRRIQEHVRQQLERGEQWPEPWLSLNPMFESGGSIESLVSEGLLHPECERVFRVKESLEDPGRHAITLHRHQRQAVETAKSGKSYVLTTGTGSGKSLAYMVPIVDRVLPQPQDAGRQSDHRLPDERAGQQPARRAREVPPATVTAEGRSRSPSPATPARSRARSGRRSSLTRPTSCSPTT